MCTLFLCEIWIHQYNVSMWDMNTSVYCSILTKQTFFPYNMICIPSNNWTWLMTLGWLSQCFPVKQSQLQDKLFSYRYVYMNRFSFHLAVIINQLIMKYLFCDCFIIPLPIIKVSSKWTISNALQIHTYPNYLPSTYPNYLPSTHIWNALQMHTYPNYLPST